MIILTTTGICKETFLQYLPLNGLLGERLFAQFDVNKRGYLDFDEFIMVRTWKAKKKGEDRKEEERNIEEKILV